MEPRKMTLFLPLQAAVPGALNVPLRLTKEVRQRRAQSHPLLTDPCIVASAAYRLRCFCLWLSLSSKVETRLLAEHGGQYHAAAAPASPEQGRRRGFSAVLSPQIGAWLL